MNPGGLSRSTTPTRRDSSPGQFQRPDYSDPDTIDQIEISREELRGNAILRHSMFLSKVCSVGALLSALTNVVMLFIFNESSPTELVVRAYSVVFALALMGVEFELSWFSSQMVLMDSWIVRGAWVAFVGLLNTVFEHPDHQHFDLWRRLVGWYLVCVGGLYAVLGLLCFRRLKVLAVTKLKRQKAMKEEVHHLTAQKLEIERLLADTESKLEDL